MLLPEAIYMASPALMPSLPAPTSSRIIEVNGRGIVSSCTSNTSGPWRNPDTHMVPYPAPAAIQDLASRIGVRPTSQTLTTMESVTTNALKVPAGVSLSERLQTLPVNSNVINDYMVIDGEIISLESQTLHEELFGPEDEQPACWGDIPDYDTQRMTVPD